MSNNETRILLKVFDLRNILKLVKKSIYMDRIFFLLIFLVGHTYVLLICYLIVATKKQITEEIKMIETNEGNKKSIYELLEKDIMESQLSDAEKAARLSYLIKVRNQKVNMMLVGVTGSGKSSTINALFDMDIAKVGAGVEPETSDIEKFELDNLVIWDTPGLGDGIEEDKKIRNTIIKKLSELDEAGQPLIDMVIVVFDASSKDLGTYYSLINEVLIPCFGEEANQRILLALNQSDVAMKGNHWDEENNMPDSVLQDYLNKKAMSIQTRIKKATGIDTRPICYCAGYKEENGEQRKPYNLTKLLYYIIQGVPKEKRLAFADNLNKEADNWLYDDEEINYKEETKKSFLYTVWDCMLTGMETGGMIGERILGVPGKMAGGVIGGATGVACGLFKGIVL